jgi:hypothetical protein
MGSTVPAARLGILQCGELTRGPLEASTGLVEDSIVLAPVVILALTGRVGTMDVQVEQSIVLQLALAVPLEDSMVVTVAPLA